MFFTASRLSLPAFPLEAHFLFVNSLLLCCPSYYSCSRLHLHGYFRPQGAGLPVSRRVALFVFCPYSTGYVLSTLMTQSYNYESSRRPLLSDDTAWFSPPASLRCFPSQSPLFLSLVVMRLSPISSAMLFVCEFSRRTIFILPLNGVVPHLTLLI